MRKLIDRQRLAQRATAWPATLGLVLALASAGSSWAQNRPAPNASASSPQDGFDAGLAAYERRDFATALRIWRPLAQGGDATAQGNLGFMYYNGQGVPQDYVQAHKWFNLSAARSTSADPRNKAVRNRDIAAAKMTAAQIGEAQRLAREWKPTGQ